MNSVKLYLGDCLEILPAFANNSVGAVITDPPYNIGKAAWDKIPNYIEWCGLWILECQRILKDNGAFYFCHNDIEQIAELIVWIKANTDFIFKQFIVWNKRYDGARNKGFLDGFVEVGGLRNYQQMAEYVLFYTFQDETGLTTVYGNRDCFINLRNYSQALREYCNYSRLKMFGILGNGRGQHFLEPFGPQWQLCTEETYQDLIDNFGVDQMVSFREYEDLRQEYEGLRYTFNNQKTHHSVWNYEIAQGNGHITPKPVPLMENILLHSTNPGDVILDPFFGGGTTGVACVQTGRNFIGIEINEKYFEIAEKRIAHAKQQLRLGL